MTLNLKVSANDSRRSTNRDLQSDSNRELVCIPARNLEIVKEKSPLKKYGWPSEVETSSRKTLKTGTNAKHVRYYKNNTSAVESQSVCRMGKERIIEAKATLLTPQSASKVYGNKFSLHKQKSHSAQPRKKNTAKTLYLDKSAASALDLPQHQPRLPNGNGSDSDISYLPRDSTADSSSFLSDSSSFDVEDVERTLTLSNPDSLDENIESQFPVTDTSDQTCDVFYEPGTNTTTTDHILEVGKSCNVSKQTLHLSPSISLPVTNIAGNALQHTSILDSAQLFAPEYLPSVVPYEFSSIESIPEDAESLDRSSEISTYSCSSMSLDQDGILLTDQYLEEPIYPVLNYTNSLKMKKYEKEISELKQSLKLAEADTAILVSSKQQLQLDNHDLNEINTSLRDQLQKAMQQTTQSAKDVAVLTRTKESDKEKFTTEMQGLQENVDRMKLKLKEVSDLLEATQLERNRIKNESSDVTKKLDSLQLMNEHLQKEVEDLLSQNTKLDALLQQASEDSCGSHDYIAIIRSERDDYAKKLHERDQDIMNKQLATRQLEERVSNIVEINNRMTSEKDEFTRSSKQKDDLICSLQTQIALKTTEKQALDGVVSRLHGDLFRVESGFTKIKKEIMQKSGLAEREISLKSQLEGKFASLKAELKQLQSDSTIQTQRISDKNNQIAQLLKQLKVETLAKSNAESKITELKSQISRNEETWVNAVKKEKELARKLNEKNKSLLTTEEKLHQNLMLLDMASTEGMQLKKEIQEQATLMSNKDEQISLLRDKTTKLQQDLNNCGDVLTLKDEAINKLAKETASDDIEMQRLNMKIEGLQRDLLTRQNDSIMEDTLNESHHQMELLAELQASRRKLSEEISHLKEKHDHEIFLLNEEIKNERKTVEEKEREIEEEKKMKEKYMNEKSDMEEVFNRRIKELLAEQKVAQETIVNLQYQSYAAHKDRDEAKSLSDHLRSIIDSKTKELEVMVKQNNNFSEELRTVKEEMNLAALKLIEEMNKERNEGGDDTRAQLVQMELERNKLREAVEHQQRYLVTLQAHYQQWAHDASLRLEEAKNVSLRKVPLKDFGTQTNHENELVRFQTSSYSTLHSLNHNDAFTQTYHDEKPICGSPMKKNNKVSTEDDFMCRKCGLKQRKLTYDEEYNEIICTPSVVQDNVQQSAPDLVQDNDSSYMSNDSLDPPNPQCNTCPTCSRSLQHSRATTQTWVYTNNEFSQTRIPLADLSTQTTPELFLLNRDHASCQTVDNLNTVATSSSQTCTVDTSSSSMQTEHSMEAVGGVHARIASLSRNLTVDFIPPCPSSDSCTQTEHDMETVGHRQPCSLHGCMEASTQTNSTQVQLYTSDSCTQTDHDNMLVGRMGGLDMKPANNVTSSLQTDDSTEQHLLSTTTVVDSYCQTEHDFEAVGHASPQSTPNERSTSFTQTYTSNELDNSSSSQILTEDSFSQTDEFLQWPDSLLPTKDVKVKMSSTQTDHNMVRVGHPFPPESIIESTCATQTDHNADPYHYPQTASDLSKPTRVKCESASQTVSVSVHSETKIHFSDFSTQTDHNGEVVGHGVNVALDSGVHQFIPVDSASQTDQEYDTLLLEHDRHSSKAEKVDCCVQTDHDSELVGQPSVATSYSKMNSSFSQTEFSSNLNSAPLTFFNESSTQTDENFGRNLQNDEGVQTDADNKHAFHAIDCSESISGLHVCGNCHKLMEKQQPHALTSDTFTQTLIPDAGDGLPPLPNPTDVVNLLNACDSVKLKAYKQTVKVLKSKLKKAEKLSSSNQEKINSLQQELELLKVSGTNNNSDLLSHHADIIKHDYDVIKKSDDVIKQDDDVIRLNKELQHWMDVAGKHEHENVSLQMEVNHLKKQHRLDMDKMRRKTTADRMLQDRKMKEANERLKALVDANERLRKTVDKLQIKLTSSTQQLEISRRDKLRYQYRARRLQTDLRSLSWISSSPTEDEDSKSTKSNNVEFESAKAELPSSVKEIDDILANLRTEINVLEKQLTNHNSAVVQSNACLKELRRHDNSLLSKSVNDESSYIGSDSASIKDRDASYGITNI